MTLEAEIAERLGAVRKHIEAAAARAGRRPEEVALVGVAKRKSAEHVAAAVCAGLEIVAENYVQEALGKIPAVKRLLEPRGVPMPHWHFVGRLQRNKARDVVRWFDVVETLDRVGLGEELERRAVREGRRLDVFLQVNLSDEPQKGGSPPEALPELLAASDTWRHLRPVGLMAIPAATDDPEATRPAFARLRALRDALRGQRGGASLTGLSMGMSGDFEVAIEEGATHVRVGTAIFGPRGG